MTVKNFKKINCCLFTGAIIKENDFFDLKLMESEEETGGYLTWNTFKILKNESKYDLTIERLYLKDIQVNPITWNNYIIRIIMIIRAFYGLIRKFFLVL